MRELKGENYKRLQAGNGGEYYSINLNASDREPQRIMDFVEKQVHKPDSKISASYAGGYFSSRQMIGELALVLSVALALLYFILAAQFESFIQPLIILLEMVIDVFFVVGVLWLLGESVNVMSKFNPSHVAITRCTKGSVFGFETSLRCTVHFGLPPLQDVKILLSDSLVSGWLKG